MRKVEMSLPKKIALLWLLLICLQAIASYFVVTPISFIASISFAIESYIAIILIFLVVKEPTKRGKFIFANFALYALCMLGAFYGGYFGSPSFRYYYYIYASKGLIVALLPLAIAYLAIDTLFRDFSVLAKYALTVLIVGGIFTFYYQPYFANPQYLLQTQEYRDWEIVDKAQKDLISSGITSPTAIQIASRVQIPIWSKGVAVGELYTQAKVNRVQEMIPYIEGNNSMLLLLRPVYYNAIYMNVFCVFFILLFFGYQYKKDPPLGAYIEKIMFLFLILCSLEILHHWAYIKALEIQTWQEFFQAGLYVSYGILALIGIFFSLRLRFIVSPTGKDYEQELVSNAQRTTRWRDVFDDLLIRHYFNPKALKGRLLAFRGKEDKE